MNTRTVQLGVVVANRDFFPDLLVAEARREVLSVLEQKGVEALIIPPDATRHGGVETYTDAVKCAALFDRHRHSLDGVLVILPNFGDEKGVTESLRQSGLNVPVLVQAYPDDPAQLSPARRRDAFCGKISVCNNLRQTGIRFSLTTRHVSTPASESFKQDLDWFVGVCRVVRGLRRVRLGAIGARPAAFNTVRYSEKILERYGVSVTTVDLSEIFARVQKLDAQAAEVRAKRDAILQYAPAPDVPADKLVTMARLGVVLDEWVRDNAIDATAVQCWTSIQQSLGCNACTLMSMMSEQLRPSACEVDVTGALTMHAMQLAADSPAALVDWNNNYGDSDDKCVLFHCGNWARSFLPDARITFAPILGSMLGPENTYGVLEGRAPAAPLTYARLTTDDSRGDILAYVGEGELTNDDLATFGSRAVARVPRLQDLLRHVCTNGFEHHVAITRSKTAAVLSEAFGTYLGWDVYRHCPGSTGGQ